MILAGSSERKLGMEMEKMYSAAEGSGEGTEVAAPAMRSVWASLRRKKESTGRQPVVSGELNEVRRQFATVTLHKLRTRPLQIDTQGIAK